ncbi:hypothetical protein [Desulfitobacterium sp. AusDCA]|uniref:hypothetical protein n=1 Tax=Desulfitobacterium sp. AusDCA TaxID=3240383 RepID=UPI003DA6F16A
MRYKYNGTETKEFVRSILPLISDICKFQVFREAKDSSFVSIEDGIETRYTFILEDEKGNEVWLNTLCGYGGGSPRETVAILQLLGIREDFDILVEGNDHIVVENLQPNHSLNFLIMAQENPVILFNARFKTAADRLNVMRSLGCFGLMAGVNKDNELSDFFTFEDTYFVDDYAVNQRFYLDQGFIPKGREGYTLRQICSMVQAIILGNHGAFNFYDVIGGAKEEQVIKFNIMITSSYETRNLTTMAKDHRDAVHRIKGQLNPEDLVVVDGDRVSKRYKIAENLNAIELASYNY